MLGMMIGMVIDRMQHEVPSSRNDWSYYKPAGEDCQEKRENGNPSAPSGHLPLHKGGFFLCGKGDCMGKSNQKASPGGEAVTVGD